MNVQKSCFETESAFKAMVSESIVEGALTLPAEKDEIDRVLLVHGKVHVGAEPGDNKVFMDGDVTFTVVYQTSDGRIDAYDSTAPFRHSEDAAGAGPGMHIYAKGSVKEVNHTLEDHRTVYVRGIVSMTLRGSVSKTCDAVFGSDIDGLQTKMFTGKLAATKEHRRELVTLREDIRVPQSMPRAEHVLMCDAYPVVKTIRLEELKIVVEGEIKMMVIYLSEDKNAPLQHFYESIPFGEIISSESVSAGDIVSADSSLFGLTVEIAEDTADVLRMTCKLSIVCSVRTMREITYLEDAYSLKSKLDISTQTYEYRNLALTCCAKAIARCAITVPDSEPSVSRVVCMKASPVVSSASPGADRVTIEGLMLFTICYASPEGMQSYSGEVPFEAEAQMEGMMDTYDVEVSAEVEYCAFEGAGRDISARFMMDVTAHAFELGRISLISDMAETDEAPPAKKGVTIYFADGGESTWDIAKRYATTLDTVQRYNPDISEHAEAGQKILIMG